MPGTSIRAVLHLNLHNMKKAKDLGKILDKEQQKKISGGSSAFSAALWCSTSPGGTQSFVSSWPSYADCRSELTEVCGTATPPLTYYECYCTPGMNPPGIACGN